MRQTSMKRLVLLVLLLVGASACSGSSPSAGRIPTSAPTASATPSATASPCPTGKPLPSGQAVMIDYVDLVMVGSRTYLHGSLGQEPATRPKALGAVVAHVRCTLSTTPHNQSAPPLADGSATFLTPGTALYAVPGLPTSCELGVRGRDGLVAYVVQVEKNNQATISDCWKHPTQG